MGVPIAVLAVGNLSCVNKVPETHEIISPETHEIIEIDASSLRPWWTNGPVSPGMGIFLMDPLPLKIHVAKYKVKKGDTWTSVAERCDKTILRIKSS